MELEELAEPQWFDVEHDPITFCNPDAPEWVESSAIGIDDQAVSDDEAPAWVDEAPVWVDEAPVWVDAYEF